MKRLLILLLCLCIAIPALPAVAADTATKIIPSPIADEILVYQGFDSDSSGFKTHGASPKRTVFQGDNRGIYTMASGFHGMGILNDKPFEKGIYCFSFDFYAESMSTDMIVRIFNEEQREIGDSGYGNNSITFESTGKYKIAKNSYFQTDIRLSGDWHAKRWYSVSVWIDTVMREVKYYINGEEAAFFDLTPQVKELKGIALFQKGEATDNVYVDNMCFSKVKDITKSVFAPVNVKYATAEDIIGNNFYADNPPVFDITYTNRLGKEINAEMYYRMFLEENEFWEKVNKTADTGTLVYTSEREALSLKPGEALNKELRIAEEYFGLMTLEVITVVDGVEYIKEIPYSMTNHTADMPHNYKSGISSHMQQQDDDPIIGSRRGSASKIIPLMARAGIGNIRSGGAGGVEWTAVEQILGQYSLSPETERMLDMLEEYNIDFVHLYANTHTAYADPAQADFDLWRPSMTPEGLQGLTNYLTALMKLAKGRIDVVEVWNEYNHNGGAYKHDQPAHAKQIETVYNGVKAGEPNVKVIGTCADWWTSIRDGNTTKLLEVINGKKILDGISIHPYNPTGGTPEEGVSKDLSDLIRGDLERTGQDRNMPFYGTEFGWSDVKAGDSKNQAACIVRALPLTWWEGSIDIVYHYTTANYGEYFFSTATEALSEGTYGLLNCTNMATDVPYLAKPSYVALAYYNGLMAEGEMLDCMNDEDYFTYKMRDRKGRDVLMMGPIGDKPFEKTYDLGCSSVTVSDMYGNEKTVYGIDGKYTFTADKSEIVYVIGSFDEIKEAQPMFKCDTASIETPINMESRVNVQAPDSFKGVLDAKVFGIDMAGETPEFKNGKAELKLKSYSYIPDINSYIQLRAVDGDKLYFEKKIPITYSSSGMIMGSARWVNTANRTDLWNLSFDVKNIRTDKSISGGVRDNQKDCGYIIPTIAPGETREIVIPVKDLKNISQIGSYDGVLNFNTGDSTELKLSEHYVAALYTDKRPTIDGVISKDEWNVGDHLAVEINDIEHVFGPGDKNAIWTGPDDLSSVAYLEYDMENFYLAVEVTDNVYHATTPVNQMYNSDSLQILIHYDLSPLNTGTEFCVGLADGKEPAMWRHMQEGNTTGYVGAAASVLYTDGECAITRKDNTTTYEVSVPWSKLKFDGGEIKKGQIMGFTYLLNDNDGTGRKNWIENGPESCIGGGGKVASRTARMVLLK